MTSKLSIFRLFAALVIMGVFPLLAIANHLNIQSKDHIVELSGQVTPRQGTNSYDIVTEISTLSLKDLSGIDHIGIGNVVFVHMAKGPNNIAYPFALTREKSLSLNDKFAFTIKGEIVTLDGNYVTVTYNFENFLPSGELATALAEHFSGKAQVELAVNQQSIPRLTAIRLNGHTFPHRVLYSPLINDKASKKPLLNFLESRP